MPGGRPRGGAAAAAERSGGAAGVRAAGGRGEEAVDAQLHCVSVQERVLDGAGEARWCSGEPPFNRYEGTAERGFGCRGRVWLASSSDDGVLRALFGFIEGGSQVGVSSCSDFVNYYLVLGMSGKTIITESSVQRNVIEKREKASQSNISECGNDEKNLVDG